MKIHNLGLPRIGQKRELKLALEAYWQGQSSPAQLVAAATQIREQNWQVQQDAGHDWLTVGDFAYYDQVLNVSLALGVVAERHQLPVAEFDRQFLVGRGRCQARDDAQATDASAAASDMTKWFNTNYHYIVPEFSAEQRFQFNPQALGDDNFVSQLHQAKQRGAVKPVVLGPVSYLFLGKAAPGIDKLALLPKLLAAYQQWLAVYAQAGIEWLQLDEPILALELDSAWQQALQHSCAALAQSGCKLLLTTYFGRVDHQLSLLRSLAVDGIHLDLVAEPFAVAPLLAQLPEHWVLSLGVVNGRNIWKADLTACYATVAPLYQRYGERIWLAPSCSLLHCPVDLQSESKLSATERSWFAFAYQKLFELNLLRSALVTGDCQQIISYSEPIVARANSAQVHDRHVAERVAALTAHSAERPAPYSQRIVEQHAARPLPILPTTTIGSFPQTAEVRALRRDLKKAVLSSAQYDEAIAKHIAHAVHLQTELGLDVLVHGEAERNDMVEYFGEQLAGFVFTSHGWVQSYGSRCVKPPIIVADISRQAPMTVRWTQYAQSLTNKPMKGMLTGPVTILGWSFPREDVSRKTMALQLALALQDEVKDLEQAGIGIIQIDEPAFREGLPLKRSAWQAYFDWAVYAFKLSCATVANSTQIHTHMCYSEFNDAIAAIAAMDADVITIETSRSNMELLSAFEQFAYPNDIGPGLYDIHTPNVPTVEWMLSLIAKAAEKIPVNRLWLNPDCGLKTRAWPETITALRNMVAAAAQARQQLC